VIAKLPSFERSRSDSFELDTAVVAVFGHGATTLASLRTIGGLQGRFLFTSESLRLGWARVSFTVLWSMCSSTKPKTLAATPGDRRPPGRIPLHIRVLTSRMGSYDNRFAIL
jgi:hypothetical protein